MEVDVCDMKMTRERMWWKEGVLLNGRPLHMSMILAECSRSTAGPRKRGESGLFFEDAIPPA